MSRRCIVCGKVATEENKDIAYHYPKNRNEARIWQRSMAAYQTSVESIEKFFCVCIEHIPQFVECTEKQASLIKDKLNQKDKLVDTSCPTPLEQTKLHVLLLAGAPVVTDGKFQDQDNDNFDEEILVRESTIRDSGINFPDVKDSEVLGSHTEEDEEHQKLAKNNDDSGDIASFHTDVLILGRSRESASDESSGSLEKLEEPHMKSYNTECTCEMHFQMDGLIKQQQQRICELEDLVNRQNDWYLSMQRKIDNLYSDFGRLDTTGGDKCIVNHESLQSQPQYPSSKS